MLTRPAGRLYSTFVESNCCTKTGTENCFPPCAAALRRSASSQNPHKAVLISSAIIQWQTGSSDGCQISNAIAACCVRPVHVTSADLFMVCKWIYTICFLRGDAVLQHCCDLWHFSIRRTQYGDVLMHSHFHYVQGDRGAAAKQTASQLAFYRRKLPPHVNTISF